MAARGTIAKNEITQKILSTFEGAFINDKEIRIPFVENGELLQLKCTLTCAKENIEVASSPAIEAAQAPQEAQPIEMTSDEKQRVSDLLKKLGL